MAADRVLHANAYLVHRLPCVSSIVFRIHVCTALHHNSVRIRLFALFHFPACSAGHLMTYQRGKGAAIQKPQLVMFRSW